MKYYNYRFPAIFIVILLYSNIAFAMAKASIFATNETPQKPEYGFAFLGDMHFDKLYHHDMGWVKDKHPGDVRQIENYSNVTTQNTPALLKSVFSSLTKQDIPTFAIIQGGDFVEGLCGNYELQALQFKEAIDLVEQSTAPVPFLITKGNHDITGPGADKAYSDIVLPWLGKQLDTMITDTSYSVEHKGDLFIFFDSYKPDLDWLSKVLEQHPARYVFFVIHKPVIPYNARAQWHIFSRDNDRLKREKLLFLLGKHHAIVLSGHLHHYSVLRRKTDGGLIFQLSMNSVIDISESKVELLEGIDEYTPELVDLEASFSANTKDARRKLLGKEKPFIDYFDLAKTPCYSLIKVSDNHIDIDTHLRSNHTAWRRLRIERATLNVTNTDCNLTNQFMARKRLNEEHNHNKQTK
jgi:hypothetical protein